MKNLVVTVSPDSSIELLASFADIIVLDRDPIPTEIPHYDTLYIRSHFGQAETLPQVFRVEIEDIVRRVKQQNSLIKCVDGIDTVDKILAIEDKWQQYSMFAVSMPKTAILDDGLNMDDFKHPIFKKRLSSHGNGVTWNKEDVTEPVDDWLVQESLDIKEELRVYVIRGEVYPVGAIRRSKTPEKSTQAVDTRQLTQEESDFSLSIAKKALSLDMIGLDIAYTSDGKLYLMEANRSPGFGVFATLTGVNLASRLYGKEVVR